MTDYSSPQQSNQPVHPNPADAEVELLEQSRLDELVRVMGPFAKETLEEAIDHFLRETPLTLIAIAQFLDEQALDQIAKRAHRLRGGSLTIGATRIANYCTQIEAHLHENTPEYLAQDLASLQAAFDATIPLLAAFRASLTPPTDTSG